MSSDMLRKDLSATVKQLMAQAVKESRLNFLGSEPAERFLGLQEGPRGWVAQIASDGLNLEQKTILEQWLLSQLKDVNTTIYFKRVKSLADRVNLAQTPQEAAVSQRKPFGIQQKLKSIPGVNRIIAVSSGKGGVGKSTVSVNLAVGLAAEGRRVGLLDADLYGPSAPLLMGLEGPMPVSPDQKILPLEKFGVKVVSFGFMSDPYSPIIWRGPMVAKALEQLFYQTNWGDLDDLIIDLPPGTGDVQLTMIENLPLFGGIVVSTPQAVALLDAHKGLSMFEKLGVPVMGLVENMSHFQCTNCGHLEDIFGQAQIEAFAVERKIPILARIPLNARIRESSDNGMPCVIGDPVAGLFYRPLVESVAGWCPPA